MIFPNPEDPPFVPDPFSRPQPQDAPDYYDPEEEEE